MKFLLVSTILVLQVIITLQDQERLMRAISIYTMVSRPYKASCIKESGMPAQLIDNFENNGTYPEDPRLGCYLKCVYILAKTMKPATGEIDMEIARKQIPIKNSQLYDIIDKRCNQPKSKDLCVVAYEVTACTVGILLALG